MAAPQRHHIIAISPVGQTRSWPIALRGSGFDKLDNLAFEPAHAVLVAAADTERLGGTGMRKAQSMVPLTNLGGSGAYPLMPRPLAMRCGADILTEIIHTGRDLHSYWRLQDL